MKYCNLLFVLLFIFAFSCKKPASPTDCPSCPLPNGEYCLNNYINVNNECVCPDDKFEIGDRCFSKGKGAFYFNINCLGFESIALNFSPIDHKPSTYNISIESNNGNSGYWGYNGDSSNFKIWLWDKWCTLPDGNKASPWLVGGISNDTMRFEIEWYFFYFKDSLGTVFLHRPEEGTYTEPLGYLDSISPYSCGEYIAVREPF